MATENWGEYLQLGKELLSVIFLCFFHSWKTKIVAFKSFRQTEKHGTVNSRQSTQVSDFVIEFIASKKCIDTISLVLHLSNLTRSTRVLMIYCMTWQTEFSCFTIVQHNKSTCIANLQILSKRRFKEREQLKFSHSNHRLNYDE